MVYFDKLMECVPNFSAGRNAATVEKLADCYRGKIGVKLLDYTSDPDHNRSVITAVGEPEALLEAVFSSVRVARELIDLRLHEGAHPRVGAADVIPFVPLRGINLQEAVALAETLGKRVAAELDIPVFLYEEAASAFHRRNLADVRRGNFEGLREKLLLPEWQPDFGSSVPHQSAGVAVIGARRPLVAFNINLNTDNLDLARQIAGRVRYSSGGLPCCKAIGVYLAAQNQAQVSMNLTDYTQTGIHHAFELVRLEARRLGVEIAGSELIGLAPAKALLDCAGYYLQLENLSIEKILEQRIYE